MAKLRTFFKLYIRYILVAVLLLLFTIISISLTNKSIYAFDNNIYDTYIAPMTSEFSNALFIGITAMADVYTFLLLTLIMILLLKNKKYITYVVINLGLAAILNLSLREIFTRSRPDNYLIETAGYSFPSGHVMLALAFYGFIIYMLWKTPWKKSIKYIYSSFLVLLIGAIGLSRIYLGAHYTSDVLAGFAIALAYLLIFTAVINRVDASLDEDEENKKSPLWKSFYHAFCGVINSIIVERNMAIHFAFAIAVTIMGFTFSISPMEWIICIILFVLVISLELVNTAIEETINICMPHFHPKAKIAKDTSAGAVLLAVIASVIIGMIIFLPKIVELFI